MKTRAPTAATLNLALQGGGAHGAFTWGVLDALLTDPTIEIGWISGTSAGAVNAVALACGLATAGRAGARDALARVWNGIVEASVPDAVKLNPLLAAPWEAMARSGAMAQMAMLFSPRDLNPLNLDPLRRILERELDVARLAATPGPELLLAATDIATGRARLFRRQETTVDVVLASACLPTLHRAVEIGGRAYWDGAFCANPDVLTLAAESPVSDTLIVQLAALTRAATPNSAREIAAHVSHLTFLRPYLETLDRLVALQKRARGAGRLTALATPNARETRIGRHRFHLIDAGRHTASLPIGSEGTPQEDMVIGLFHAGQQEAGKWLDRHRSDIGRRDTAELSVRLLVTGLQPNEPSNTP